MKQLNLRLKFVDDFADGTLSTGVIVSLSPKYNIIEIEPGQFLAQETCGCDGLYIIKEGQLEVYRKGKNGEKIILGVIQSGEYVGETALLMDRPYTSNVVALTKVKAVKLPKAVVDAQLKQVPSWLIALTKGLITRLQSSNGIIEKYNVVDDRLTTTVENIGSNVKKVEDDAA